MGTAVYAWWGGTPYIWWARSLLVDLKHQLMTVVHTDSEEVATLNRTIAAGPPPNLIKLRWDEVATRCYEAGRISERDGQAEGGGYSKEEQNRKGVKDGDSPECVMMDRE